MYLVQEGVNKPGICDIYKTDQPQFAYIADVCVSKHARRLGIGRNMIFLAINISFSHGKIKNKFSLMFLKY
jgi:ribosomal protein S18 acetylase RimI-like enzyme